jgi:hypothetical protein
MKTSTRIGLTRIRPQICVFKDAYSASIRLLRLKETVRMGATSDEFTPRSTAGQRKLLDRVRDAIRFKDYSLRTEKPYTEGIQLTLGQAGGAPALQLTQSVPEGVFGVRACGLPCDLPPGA